MDKTRKPTTDWGRGAQSGHCGKKSKDRCSPRLCREHHMHNYVSVEYAEHSVEVIDNIINHSSTQTLQIDEGSRSCQVPSSGYSSPQVRLQAHVNPQHDQPEMTYAENQQWRYSLVLSHPLKLFTSAEGSSQASRVNSRDSHGKTSLTTIFNMHLYML